MIRWPRKRQNLKDRLVVSWSGQTVAYVLARDNGSRGYEVLKSGVESQPGGANGAGLENMVRRLKALSLDGFPVSVVLHPEQYQLLRIRAPAVAPDELRAAARYQIIKMINTHIDDVTIDVMQVGDGRPRGTGHLAGHLFVVAAKRTVIRGVVDLCDAMRWRVSVIDIQETAQRNLQTALMPGDGRQGRASAGLVMLNSLQAVLTVCANGALFYTRRFDLPQGFLKGAWDNTPLAPVATDLAPSWLMAPEPGLSGEFDEAAIANRFLLEVQRTLDVWDRTWPTLPLYGLSLYAGGGSGALSVWLSQQLGQPVQPINLSAHFAGFKSDSVVHETACLPLLGLLLRTAGRSL